MSSNRLIYDKCAYASDIKESTEPLEYNLFVGKYENCKECPVGKYGNVLPFGPKTDTESELLGLSRPTTNCPGLQFQKGDKFNNMPLSAARMCDSIYYITPNNLVKPTSNMINEKNLGINSCNSKKKVKEYFDNTPTPTFTSTPTPTSMGMPQSYFPPAINNSGNNGELMKYANCEYYPARVIDVCNGTCTNSIDPTTDVSGNQLKTCKAYCAYNNKLYNEQCSASHPILNSQDIKSKTTSKECADNIIKKCVDSIKTNIINDKYKNIKGDIDTIQFKDFHSCLKENNYSDC